MDCVISQVVLMCVCQLDWLTDHTCTHTHTHMHTHTHTCTHTLAHCEAVSGQSITQNKALKPRVKPDRPCERVIVCDVVCVWQSDDCSCSKRMISGPALSQPATILCSIMLWIIQCNPTGKETFSWIFVRETQQHWCIIYTTVGLY